VALAAAGRTSSASATSATQAQAASGAASLRRFASRSAEDAVPSGAIAVASGFAASGIDSADQADLPPKMSLSPEYAARAARDAAVLAINGDPENWWTESAGDDETAFDESELRDLFAELATA
jgi:hypothetical protein